MSWKAASAKLRRSSKSPKVPPSEPTNDQSKRKHKKPSHSRGFSLADVDEEPLGDSTWICDGQRRLLAEGSLAELFNAFVHFGFGA